MTLAIVTGAGNGIGAVIAARAAEAGYRVVLWDINDVAVKKVAESIGPAATWDTVDVSSEESVAAGFAALDEAPDLVVNNAGTVRFGPLSTLSLPDWEVVLRVNLTGCFLVSRAAVALMAEHGGGSIVNLSSVNGIAAAPNAGAYTSTKAAVIMLTEQMALEWGQHNVRVNAVAPGLILAGMSDAIYADPDVRKHRQGQVPLGRLGTAEQVADSVLFLASPAAEYITGQHLAVDGGLTKAGLQNLSRPRSVDSVGS
jgi:NAD(P)-dependent dehydrogenase (short-subunit alcohol dehydrogenase family)